MTLSPRVQAQVEAAKELEVTMLLLFEHLKYPVDVAGNVLDMNHLPDVPTTLAYHLARLGWRCYPEKALIKQRPVQGPGYYEDLVAYVPVTAADEPIRTPEPPKPELWSVTPEVNDVYEARNE